MASAGQSTPGQGAAPLLRLCVELPGGGEDSILIRPSEDDPAALAEAFVARNGLAEYAAVPLAAHIAQHSAQCADLSAPAAARPPPASPRGGRGPSQRPGSAPNSAAGSPASRRRSSQQRSSSAAPAPGMRRAHHPAITARAQQLQRDAAKRRCDLYDRGVRALQQRRERPQRTALDDIPETTPYTCRKVVGLVWGPSAQRRADGRSAAPEEPPGPRLYAQAVGERLAREARAKKEQQRRSEEELKQAPFQPCITPLARDMKRDFPAYMLRRREPQATTSDDVCFLENCTFAPNVPKARRRSSSAGGGVFEQLYTDASGRDARRRVGAEQHICELQKQQSGAAHRGAAGKATAEPVVRLVRRGGAAATFARLAQQGARRAEQRCDRALWRPAQTAGRCS
eukprot:TRINITY_DN1582_c0_g1_i4.p1 TRINITY_DN1582_c0_g1~~TRINITY_DN1582_c0_g1_i4.p1  ORF type:complete len:421 (+),score=129.56 TRINITY_DN1582_c0_g1_i4:68-1264(+)